MQLFKVGCRFEVLLKCFNKYRQSHFIYICALALWHNFILDVRKDKNIYFKRQNKHLKYGIEALIVALYKILTGVRWAGLWRRVHHRKHGSLAGHAKHNYKCDVSNLASTPSNIICCYLFICLFIYYLRAGQDGAAYSQRGCVISLRKACFIKGDWACLSARALHYIGLFLYHRPPRTKAEESTERQLNVWRRQAEKVKMFILFLKRVVLSAPFRLIGWTWQWLTCIHGNRAANLPSPIGNHRRGLDCLFLSPLLKNTSQLGL